MLNLTSTTIQQIDYATLVTELKDWAVAKPEAAVAFVALILRGGITGGIARLLWAVIPGTIFEC